MFPTSQYPVRDDGRFPARNRRRRLRHLRLAGAAVGRPPAVLPASVDGRCDAADGQVLQRRQPHVVDVRSAAEDGDGDLASRKLNRGVGGRGQNAATDRRRQPPQEVASGQHAARLRPRTSCQSAASGSTQLTAYTHNLLVSAFPVAQAIGHSSVYTLSPPPKSRGGFTR